MLDVKEEGFVLKRCDTALSDFYDFYMSKCIYLVVASFYFLAAANSEEKLMWQPFKKKKEKEADRQFTSYYP